jgi:hypothetical protein
MSQRVELFDGLLSGAARCSAAPPTLLADRCRASVVGELTVAHKG